MIGGLTSIVAAAPGIWLLFVGRRDRLRAQAEQVTAWSVREVRSSEGGKETPPSGVVVVNASSSEVRDVAVKVISRTNDDVVGKRYNAVAPGSYYLKYDNGEWSAPSALSAEGGYLSLADIDQSTGAIDTISMLPITEVPPEQTVALLRFRTSNGRRWVRLSGSEVEPEYLVKMSSGPDGGRTLRGLNWSLLRWWRCWFNPLLREDLAAVRSKMSTWDDEFSRTQSVAATLPEFAPRVSPKSNVVAGMLRRALATLFESGNGIEREVLLSSAPRHDDPDHFKRVTVKITGGSALPVTIVSARATASPGRSLVFLTNDQTPSSQVYYFSVDVDGTLPAEFFFGDTRKGFKADNAPLTKEFVKEAEARGRPGGGTVDSWIGSEEELMATIGAVISKHEHARMPVPS